MTQNNNDNVSRNHSPDLESAVNAMRNDEPSAAEVQTAGGRIFQKLQASASETLPEAIRGCDDVMSLLPAYRAAELSPERALLVETHLRDCVTCRQRAEGRTTVVEWKQAAASRAARGWSGWAVAAAAVVLAGLGLWINNAYFAIPAGARATLQSVNGTAYLVTADGDRPIAPGEKMNDGDVFRTGAGSHAYVRLSDGSLVEVSERSSFSVKARGNNMTVDLDRGAVIVQATKRTSGHLYVKTPDCRVAVTGTVFSVNSGVKGSRVSVVEGTVQVAFSGNDNVLHGGDQVSTGSNMSAVPVADEIAWSQDLAQHLELLAQIKKLENRLAGVALPAPRYSSNLLAHMPAGTLFYASLPNAGQALEDANRILQEQIQQSDTLRQWWTNGQADNNDEWNEMVGKLRLLSDYLGDEVVIVGLGGHQSIAAIAEVNHSGLRDFLETKFTTIGKNQKLVVVEPKDLASLPLKSSDLVALVRDKEVIFSDDRATLMRLSAQLDANAQGFEASEFGQRIADAYSRGAGFFFAADLHGLIQSGDGIRRGSTQRGDFMSRSGFSDMRYLVVEHREINNVPDNRLVLDFAGQRKGAASWLAAPAPMGSLEFVSRNAAVAVAFVAKDPQLMLSDVFNMGESTASAQKDLNQINSKLNLDIQRDLAAHFGGDGVLALDGSVLPSPSWEFVIEVRDTEGLEASLQTLVQSYNADAQREGRSGVDLNTEDVNGQRYYTVQWRESKAKPMCYTFSSGFMIIGSDRATLMGALRTRATGDSLARSGDFKALLPKDDSANYSFVAYQNLAPILQPLLSTVGTQQAKAIQELAADTRPSVACGWGRDNRIEAVSNSRLLGFDWMTLRSLFAQGTTLGQTP